MAELASYELEGRIATIAMDDGKVNAFSIEMLKAVMAALDRAEQDEAVVVLTGREKYFSAGFDLKVFTRAPGRDRRDADPRARGSRERLLSFPTPVLVACNGHAIAAGTFPALAADLRIGVEGPYKLGLNEVKIGLTVPLYVVELARQRLTPRDFNRSLVTAAMYSPEEAVAAGLLDRDRPGRAAARGEPRRGRGARRPQHGRPRGDQAAGPRGRPEGAARGDRRRARPAGRRVVNVLIAADMEGIAGIEDYGECLPSHPPRTPAAAG